jgi:hypothetical protein
MVIHFIAFFSKNESIVLQQASALLGEYYFFADPTSSD